MIQRVPPGFSSLKSLLQHFWSLDHHRLEQLLLLKKVLLLLLHVLLHLLLPMVLHALGDRVDPVLRTLITTSTHIGNPKPSPHSTNVACILCKLANFTWSGAVPA